MIKVNLITIGGKPIQIPFAAIFLVIALGHPRPVLLRSHLDRDLQQGSRRQKRRSKRKSQSKDNWNSDRLDQDKRVRKARSSSSSSFPA